MSALWLCLASFHFQTHDVWNENQKTEGLPELIIIAVSGCLCPSSGHCWERTKSQTTERKLGWHSIERIPLPRLSAFICSKFYSVIDRINLNTSDFKSQKHGCWSASRSRLYCLRISGKCRKTFLDSPFYPAPYQIQWSLIWAGTHPQSKFHGNQLSSFCVIKQTDMGKKHNLLDGGNKWRRNFSLYFL